MMRVSIERAIIIAELHNYLSLCSVVTLSVPATASVAEESGPVQVCATLSDVPAGGYVAIEIMLATSDGI